MAAEGTGPETRAAKTKALIARMRVAVPATLTVASTNLPLDLDCQTKSDLRCRLHTRNR